MQSLVQLYVLVAVFCLLLFKPPKEILVNQFSKSFLFLLILLISSVKILTEARILSSSPVIYITGNIALFVFIPAIYLYLRNHVNNGKETNKDIIHILPSFGYSVICILLFVFENNHGLVKADIF